MGFRVFLDLSASPTESFVGGGVLFGSGFVSGWKSWSRAVEAPAVLTEMAVGSAALADAGGAGGSAVLRETTDGVGASGAGIWVVADPGFVGPGWGTGGLAGFSGDADCLGVAPARPFSTLWAPSAMAVGSLLNASTMFFDGVKKLNCVVVPGPVSRS
ncbi:Uncharacterised protein [Mycobacteroides abscessus subsp. abscessus]|nr:Uncharacterised protein [Mycobacteroides abscessus subsp. abscessus]